ncbi:unnamed protein product [Paramecium primaurelia]|uniref:Uncharacterized protein n=1 Tax=Paramecium primaurelia TaxID=5886 RepID=A0A8S1NEI1_PARPR|nr:unnamed protein product [Paramecium primaurelia]
MQNNQNSEVQSQFPVLISQNYFQNEYDQELEMLEIEAEKQCFSQLFDELCAYSINPQEETSIQKKKCNKINKFRKGSNKILKKQQEKKRKEQLIDQILQKHQRRDFNEFKQKVFIAECNTEDIQEQQGEWHQDHQEQVQEHVVIPLGYLNDCKDQMLLNLRINKVNNNDNCSKLNNNYEINNNSLLMNAFHIPIANAPILPNL